MPHCSWPEATISLEIVDLYSAFGKFIAEKVDMENQAV